MRNCWMRPRRGNCTTRGPDTPTTRRQRASCRANPQLRPARRPPICHNTPAITTTRQNSHVIRLREHSTTSRNVAIPTTTIQCLKQSRGNYVRNWWALGNRSTTGVFPQRKLLATLRGAGSSPHSAAQAPHHTPYYRPVTQTPPHTLSCTDDEATANTSRSSPTVPTSRSRCRYAEGPTWRSAPRRIPSTQCK